MSRPHLLLALLLFAMSSLSAQYYIEPAVRVGRVIPNASNVGWLSNVSMYGAEIRFGKQTTGKYAWEKLFNYPEMGIAARYGHFDSPVLGYKFALFGYLNGTIYRIRRWTFHYQFGFGISYWSNPYNLEANPRNRFIGSHINAHIDLALGVDCRLSGKTALTLRANFSHSSNAALKLPNMGINPLSGAIGLKCYLQKPDSLEFNWKIRDTAFRKSNSFYVMASVGTRQSKKDAVVTNGAAGPYYIGLNLQIGYLRQFHPKFRYGGGIDINYSSELARQLNEGAEHKHSKYISQAVFATFEVMYGRLVLHVSGAVYINRAFAFNTPFYERAGMRVLLGKEMNHFVGASVKANAGSVDFLELHYGYRFVQFGKGWRKF
ncbi:MAG: acyloxyacyl hydrolase [Bacteroidales bacterium]|nr:acyloxyacyl hydrolase [Bacteroidales bacterium]